jgi:hypothetical protein
LLSRVSHADGSTGKQSNKTSIAQFHDDLLLLVRRVRPNVPRSGGNAVD